MRPYKKRSFYNQFRNSNEHGMEFENSDDSEKQGNSPPVTDDTEKEKDKDKEGEVKNRKKWKRKISRKQFRHHDIKLFTPGEYRTSTFLKQKEPSPTLSKKPDAISKESITETILNSLGGPLNKQQQQHSLAQKTSRLEDMDSNNVKTDVEENNNVNTAQNNNSVGKHQLPAIIMETPPIRRSVESIIHKPNPNFVKSLDQTGAKKMQRQEMNTTKTTEDMHSAQKKLIVNSKVPQYGNSQAEEALNPIKDEKSRLDLSNSSIENNVEPIRDNDVNREEARPSGKPSQSVGMKSVAPKAPEPPTAPEPMETTEYPLEQPENLSLKRRYSVETPVDLSKKGAASQIPEIPSKDRILPYNMKAANGYEEPSTLEASRRAPYFSHPIIEPNKATAKDTTTTCDHCFKRPDYLAQNDKGPNGANQKENSEKCPRMVKKALIKPVQSDTAKPPPPYPKDRLNATEPKNHPNDSIRKITILHMWRKHLQELLQQQFHTPILNLMSHAYQQLDAIKNEPYVPSEVKWNAQKVLAETYNFISDKLKQFGLDVNPIDVIKILGQTENNAEKTTLQNNLENIHRIRMLDLNDYRPPQVPTSISPFVHPQNKLVREFPKVPYVSNFTPRHQAPNVAGQSVPSRIPSSPKPGDLPGNLDVHVSRASDINELRYHQRLPHIMPMIPPFGCGNNNLTLPPSFPREVQMAPSNPYMNYPVNDIAKPSYLSSTNNASRTHHNSVGRPRSKSQKQTMETPMPQQLRRSLSNPLDKNYPLGFQWATGPNGYLCPPHSVGLPNLLQNGDLSITPSNQKSMLAPPMYHEGFHQRVQEQITKDAMKYRHSFPEYPVKKPAAPPAVHGLVMDNNYQKTISSKSLPQKAQATPIKSPKKQLQTLNIPSDKMASITDHHRQQVYEEANVIKQKSQSSVPAVIVADTSMQITKEPPRDRPGHTGMEQASNGLSMTLISNHKEKELENNLNKPSSAIIDQNQEENTSEFQVWLKKLNNNAELKNKFLSHMGIIKKEEPATSNESDECIEISDSDEEKHLTKLTEVKQSDTSKKDLKEQSHSIISKPPPSNFPCLQEAAPSKLINSKTICVPRALEITPIPPQIPSPKQSLSKLDYIPPIALPYVPTSTATLQHNGPKKAIYSPEIEPISPVSNEQTFTYPPPPQVVTPAASKMLPPPVATDLGERGVVLRENVTSPSYNQKRKTPLGFATEESSISPKGTFASFPPDNASKRRKSLDRPQIAISPRVAPSGKLCYVRESHMFLRYFDDTQVELFIKNLSSQDEELLRTTGIDPEKIKNSYKQSNFRLEQLSKTDVIHLPRDVEFSRKEDLPDVEEFVKESNLVQRFVPRDFADFYRYVTGFQIIKNKHPVSLQTFLTMYNTNRTTELLRKYLQRRDEDTSAIVPR